MTDPPILAGADPGGGANRIAAWHSYLVGDTDVLRNLPGIADEQALAEYSRLMSAAANIELNQATSRDRPLGFDLVHLADVHRRLFDRVFPFAGQLRYVDLIPAGQRTDPFIHHAWLTPYAAAVTEQLHGEDDLLGHTDPGQWADRAAYYWAAMGRAHPFREGNGRAIRSWLTDLAAAADHTLDWDRADTRRNHLVGVLAGGNDREPMRALLTTVAGGTVGVDRPVHALDDLDTLLVRQAWARTGLAVGAGPHQAALTAELDRFGPRIAETHAYLAAHGVRRTTMSQPATDRWRGLVVSHFPTADRMATWPERAADLDRGAATGADIARQLAAVSSRARPPGTRPDSEPAPPPRPAEGPPRGFGPHGPPPSPEAGGGGRPPPRGPRR